MAAPMKTKLLRLLLMFYSFLYSYGLRAIGEREMKMYRDRVSKMFHHAYDGYIQNAYPYDELRPLTCDGHDTWGSFSLTLIDALDTLAIMGNHSEFTRVADLLIDSHADFDIDINASVFETNIRVVGGLLSAHLLTRQAGMTLEPGWPCSGPLLRIAEDVARKLLPAFDTKTGMPYGTVNLRHGVPKGETPVTCTAGVGTFIVEFGALSRLTGDPIFEETAMRALKALWDVKSEIGLVGNHIDVQTGQWTALDAGIGAGVDSYFEYLVKGSILFQMPELMEHFNSYKSSIETYLKQDDWYLWAHMKKGHTTLPIFQSLEAYWPGVQSLIGDINKAMKSLHNYHQVWKQFGFTPEFYNIPKSEVHGSRGGYPLRPELIESVMYLYKATKDPYLLEVGVDILESIEYSAKTKCGYATVQDVKSHVLENRMESFFLAETTKYLYLLFDVDNFIHNTGNHGSIINTPSGECIVDAGGYVFNTEAHPIDAAALYCCSVQKDRHEIEIQTLEDNLNLLSLLDLVDNEADMFPVPDRNSERGSDSDNDFATHDDVTRDDVTHDDVTHDVKQDKTTQDDVIPGDVTHSHGSQDGSTDGDITAQNEVETGYITEEDVKSTHTDQSGKSESDQSSKSVSESMSETSSLVDTDSKSTADGKDTAYSQLKDYIKQELEKFTMAKFTSENTENVDGENQNNNGDGDTGQKTISTDEKVQVQSAINTKNIPLNNAQGPPGTSEHKESTNKDDLSAFNNLLNSVFKKIYTEFKDINLLNTDTEKTTIPKPVKKTLNPKLMTCQALPFHSRLSVMGVMFADEK